ncbi:MAG: VWA domain-containing protein [Anaerolineae bacterium]|nr:VWA domain-containing protein [Anaerolineae bacterium]MDW8298075.1 VWA domain-containing protein [Anaerolineae bacterium]
MSDSERLRRWRLVLGSDACSNEMGLRNSADRAIDAALEALYGAGSGQARKGGLGSSVPSVARWLGDIRRYFPASVVRVLQKDALERLNLKQMLLEPEFLQSVVPDVHLATALISLKDAMPDETRATARMVVAQVVRELQQRLALSMQQAVTGSLSRAARTRRPRLAEIDWTRTIRANLRHYQPDYRTVVPETRIGYAKRRRALQDVILCVDQSGSMASSIVYAGVFGAVMASLPSLSTRFIAFDTAVVDLTEALSEPVDLLFGVQLGGGTDIHQALRYCQGLVSRPAQTALILISDLHEGGSPAGVLQCAAELVEAGVQLIVLLALSDDGAPSYDHRLAAQLAALGIVCFACTPDQFPSLMAAALSRADLSAWAAAEGIVTARAED